MRAIKEDHPKRPSEILRALRGDVDAIVLKALDKNPAGRYTSAADLARDVRHHLANEPIEARAPSRWVRMTRWIAKRPVLSTTIACCLMIGCSLLAIQATLWYGLSRPDHLEFDVEKHETRLVTGPGATLARWGLTGENVDWHFVREPAVSGGKSLAMVSFVRNADPNDDAVLKAFDVSGDLSNPVWTQRITDGDLNEYCVQRGFRPRSFTPRVCLVDDVFPENPGPEIVVAFQNAPHSQCLIRILDSRGTTHYQVWQDGGVGHAYWMHDAGILVLEGRNGVVPWEHRECPNDTQVMNVALDQCGHPMVIFGIRPQYGLLESRWLAADPAASAPAPEWYLCVWPPIVDDWIAQTVSLLPPNGASPGSAVALSITAERGVGVSWEVDSSGKVVPGSFNASGGYQRTPGLPDPSVFELRRLPRVRGFAEEPRVTPYPVDSGMVR